MRSLFAVALVFATVLAGCSSPSATVSTSSSSTIPSTSSMAAPEPFSIPAPDIQPGFSWVHSLDASGKASIGPYTAPISTHLSGGDEALASGYIVDGAPVLVGAGLVGKAGSTNLTRMFLGAAFTLDPADLGERDLGDAAFLRACQVDPSTCPTDLSPYAHKPGSTLDLGDMQFPLRQDSAWDSDAAPEGATGSAHIKVVDLAQARVLGRDLQVVRLNFTASYRFDERQNDTRVTGTVTVDGTLQYSPDFMSVSEESTHTVSHLDGSADGMTLHVVEDVRTSTALAAIDLTPRPSLDPIDLYDAFHLHGRTLSVQAEAATPGHVNVAITGKETPLSDLAWTLTDPTGAVAQHGTTAEFPLSLGDGVYGLHAEARHNGRVLVHADANLTAQGVVAGPKPAPQEVRKTVSCDPFVANLPGGVAQGACPDVGANLTAGYTTLHATSLANTTLPNVSGTLQLLDPAGAVAASAATTASGEVKFTPSAPLEPGVWKARFLPQVGFQMSVYVHITAT